MHQRNQANSFPISMDRVRFALTIVGNFEQDFLNSARTEGTIHIEMFNTLFLQYQF